MGRIRSCLRDDGQLSISRTQSAAGEADARPAAADLSPEWPPHGRAMHSFLDLEEPEAGDPEELPATPPSEEAGQAEAMAVGVSGPKLSTALRVYFSLHDVAATFFAFEKEHCRKFYSLYRF